jgi:hypothetical protein
MDLRKLIYSIHTGPEAASFPGDLSLLLVHSTPKMASSPDTAWNENPLLTNIVEHEIKSLFCFIKTLRAPFIVYSPDKVYVTAPATNQ